jgi:hypothetical protein
VAPEALADKLPVAHDAAPGHNAQPGAAVPHRPPWGGESRVERGLLAALYAIGIWQFLVLAYWPQMLAPRKRDERAGQALVRRLKELGGDAFLPNHGFLQTMAGSNTFHAHMMAMSDVLRGKDRGVAAKLEGEIRQALRTGKFDVLVVDAAPEGMASYVRILAKKHGFGIPDVGPNLLDLFGPDILAGYRLLGPVFAKDDVFWPVTGMEIRPDRIYVRNQ